VHGPIRKLVTIAVLVGAVVLGGRLLGVLGRGPVPLEIHYLLGDPPGCVALEVVATPVGADEAAGSFATSIIGRDVIQRTRLPGGEERLDITLVGASGARRTVRRTIVAERDAVVRIDLSREGAVP
jgi:hypothetical protein